MTTDLADPPRAPAAPRVRVRVAAVLLAATAVVGGAGWWLTSPGLIGGYNGSTRISMENEVGDTALYDAGVYPARDGGRSSVVVELVAAAPRVVENTAAADISVVVCLADGHGDDRIGAVRDEPGSASCQERVPVEGATVDIPAGAQVAVRVTAHRPGTVRVAGLDLTYRDGIRAGTVHTGLDFEATWTEGSRG